MPNQASTNQLYKIKEIENIMKSFSHSITQSIRSGSICQDSYSPNAQLPNQSELQRRSNSLYKIKVLRQNFNKTFFNIDIMNKNKVMLKAYHNLQRDRI
jgi:hypothetical protein